MKTENQFISEVSKNFVTLNCPSNRFQPIYVFDFSKPIIEIVEEEVEDVTDQMEVISQRYNPFMKTTIYTVRRWKVLAYKVVFSTHDYLSAVRFAKIYAKKENLLYQV